MTVQGLQKRKLGFESRRADKMNVADGLKYRLGALRTARGDALAEGQDVGALDSEIENVERDIRDCKDEIAGLDRAIEKAICEIRTAIEEERNARDHEARAQTERNLGQALKHFEPMKNALVSSVNAAIPLVFSPGAFCPNFSPIDNLLTHLPAEVQNMFRSEINARYSQFISGSKPWPVDEFASVLPVPEKSARRKRDELQLELVNAQNRFRSAIERRDKIKAEFNKIEQPEIVGETAKAVEQIADEIRDLENEIAKLDKKEVMA